MFAVMNGLSGRGSKKYGIPIIKHINLLIYCASKSRFSSSWATTIFRCCCCCCRLWSNEDALCAQIRLLLVNSIDKKPFLLLYFCHLFSLLFILNDFFPLCIVFFLSLHIDIFAFVLSLYSFIEYAPSFISIQFKFHRHHTWISTVFVMHLCASVKVYDFITWFSVEYLWGE